MKPIHLPPEQSYPLLYDHSMLALRLPAGLSADIILPNETPGVDDPVAEIRRAIDNPVDDFSFDDYRGVKKVVIAVNDKTRPVPHELILPGLLKKLSELAISDNAITLLVATGTHAPMPDTEMDRLLPPGLAQRYRVVSHNCDDDRNLVVLGKTSRGTEVAVNRLFHEADLKIVTGNIEPHHFAGFSGGAKSAAIGVAARATIRQNHRYLLEPDSFLGIYETNPLRQDIEEIGRLMGIDLSLNIIMNANHQVVKAFCGRPENVMKAGIPLSREICQTEIDDRYDLVIASAGGYPKDINLYQAQKALTHASLLTRDGGTVILAAACAEGVGSLGYEKFMEGINSTDQVYEKLAQQGFDLGAHKAFLFARQIERVHILLLSQLAGSKVRSLLLTPIQTLEEAISRAIEDIKTPTRIAVLPHATQTIPNIR